MKIKICGMKFPDNIVEVAQLKPDYMGFIFYERSPRNFTGEIPEISGDIKKTGVFVNVSIDYISNKVEEYNFKAVQLHGGESAEFCRELKRVLPKDVELIKVFSVLESIDFEILKNYEGIVDYFLFDTKGKNKGGNGITFNWEILKNYPSSTPFFLSGGIGLEEFQEIEEFKQHMEDLGKGELLYAVDVNSKFETEPGQKNKEDLEKFSKKIATLRSSNN
jgi:phosphoribosylanthranilate isomerase